MSERTRCPGCEWAAWTAANPNAPHRHVESMDGPREGCCAHTHDAERALLDESDHSDEPHYRSPLRDIPDLYLPDGSPVNGPRTTAAELADMIAATHSAERGIGRTMPWHLRYLTTEHRNAAAYEGDLYAEAIRGARAMRSADATPETYAGQTRTSATEREHGIPFGWITR